MTYIGLPFKEACLKKWDAGRVERGMEPNGEIADTAEFRGEPLEEAYQELADLHIYFTLAEQRYGVNLSFAREKVEELAHVAQRARRYVQAPPDSRR